MFPVRMQCRLLGVSSSGYHGLRRRLPSARARANAALSVRVQAIHTHFWGTYGVPRVQAELAAQGTRVGRKRRAPHA
jgi:putative transposase